MCWKGQESLGGGCTARDGGSAEGRKPGKKIEPDPKMAPPFDYKSLVTCLFDLLSPFHPWIKAVLYHTPILRYLRRVAFPINPYHLNRKKNIALIHRKRISSFHLGQVGKIGRCCWQETSKEYTLFDLLYNIEWTFLIQCKATVRNCRAS